MNEPNQTESLRGPGSCVLSLNAALGLVLVLPGIVFLVLQLQIARWPSTTGTLLVAEVGQRGRSKTGYYPEVHYTYTVAGRTYEGHTYTAIQTATSEYDSAWSRVNALREQQRREGHITVYYKPSRPARSILDAKPGIIGFILFTCGLSFAFLLMRVPYESQGLRWRCIVLSIGSLVGMAAALFSPGYPSLVWWMWPIWAGCVIASYLLGRLIPDKPKPGTNGSIAV